MALFLLCFLLPSSQIVACHRLAEAFRPASVDVGPSWPGPF